MRIALLKNVKINDGITLSKNEEGTLRGVTWSSDGDRYHVEFPQGSFQIDRKDFEYTRKT